MHSRQCLLSTDPATCLLTQPFACLPSHLPVDPISTFFSSSVVPGHRRASARTSLINSAHPGPARLARALEWEKGEGEWGSVGNGANPIGNRRIQVSPFIPPLQPYHIRSRKC